MDAATMAALIVANLKSLNPDITGAQEAELLNYWEQICQGIIDHIIAAAVVQTTVVVDTGSSAGTYPGTGGITS